VSLSGEVERSFDLNQGMLCAYGLSKGQNWLELSGKNKQDNQLTKKALHTSLYYSYNYHRYCCYHYYYNSHWTTYRILRRNLKKKTLFACTLSIKGISGMDLSTKLELSENDQRRRSIYQEVKVNEYQISFKFSFCKILWNFQ